MLQLLRAPANGSMYTRITPAPACAPVVSHRRPTRAPRSRRLRVRAVDGEYNANVPNLDFVNQVLKVFPEEGVANVDEARVRHLAAQLRAEVGWLRCYPLKVSSPHLHATLNRAALVQVSTGAFSCLPYDPVRFCVP